MMRIVCAAVCVALILCFTVFHHWQGGGGFVLWLVNVTSGVLSLFALIVLATFILAKVPLKPFGITAAAFAAEFFSAVKLFGFDMIRGAPPLTPSTATRNDTNQHHLPILFVHGFTSNSGFWCEYVTNFAPRWGNTLATVNLEPIHTSIKNYAQQIDQAIDALLEHSQSSQCLIVAHSMGGLATRSYLHQYTDAHKVKGVITLGTPHHGTTLAALGLGDNSRQMRRESEWRQKLLAHEKNAVRPEFECLIGTHDNIVAPQESAEYEYGTNTYMTGITHLAMAYDKQVMAWVFDRANRLSH